MKDMADGNLLINDQGPPTDLSEAEITGALQREFPILLPRQFGQSNRCFACNRIRFFLNCEAYGQAVLSLAMMRCTSENMFNMNFLGR